MNRKLRERFERYVDRSGEHHLWTGATDPARGTGRIKVDRKTTRAHRLAWELEHGPLPDGVRVTPCEDEPACVRVDHLRCDQSVAEMGHNALPPVELLDGTTRRMGSVDVLGVADPTFTADNELRTDEANEIKRDAAPAVARLVRRRDPDVLAVHDSRQAEFALGHVPLVLSGHTHTRAVDEQRGTLSLTVGSTGATGLGSFTVTTISPTKHRS